MATNKLEQPFKALWVVLCRCQGCWWGWSRTQHSSWPQQQDVLLPDTTCSLTHWAMCVFCTWAGSARALLGLQTPSLNFFSPFLATQAGPAGTELVLLPELLPCTALVAPGVGTGPEQVWLGLGEGFGCTVTPP